jgi:AcrR family transcriptional regulator
VCTSLYYTCCEVSSSLVYCTPGEAEPRSGRTLNSVAEPSNARGRRTRAALLAAARSLLEEHGFEALTMAAVAERAGVSRRAIYLHFTSRSELVSALFRYVAEAEGLEDSTRPVWEAPDAVAALDTWARHLARYHPRILAVARAIERVRRVDPDAARYRDQIRQAQHGSCRRLAAGLERERRLAPRWTVESAADMLWALISSDLIEGLLVDRGWSRERLAEHLALLFRSTFVRDAPAADIGRRDMGAPERQR